MTLEKAFQRLLVPVDFSEGSARAVRFAVAFGSRMRAEVEVLHAWHSDLATGVTFAKERAKNALREFVGSLDLQGDVVLRRRIEHGDPYLTIQSAAQLGGHDSIVLAGSKGPRREANVAASLLATAPCAVLFVPPSASPPARSERDRSLRLERVLVPLAFAGSRLEALDCAEALAEADRATIELLASRDVSPEALALLAARPARDRSEIREDSAECAAAVLSRVHGSTFDLLVMSGNRAAIGERPADDRVQRLVWSLPQPSLVLRG